MSLEETSEQNGENVPHPDEKRTSEENVPRPDEKRKRTSEELLLTQLRSERAEFLSAIAKRDEQISQLVGEVSRLQTNIALLQGADADEEKKKSSSAVVNGNAVRLKLSKRSRDTRCKSNFNGTSSILNPAVLPKSPGLSSFFQQQGAAAADSTNNNSSGSGKYYTGNNNNVDIASESASNSVADDIFKNINFGGGGGGWGSGARIHQERLHQG